MPQEKYRASSPLSGYDTWLGLMYSSNPMSTLLRRIRRTWFVLLVLAWTPVVCGAQAIAPVIEVQNPPNSPSQQAKHYVVLVSLDGFRYDYAQKYGAKNLLAMARRGASAPDGMIPSYP